MAQERCPETWVEIERRGAEDKRCRKEVGRREVSQRRRAEARGEEKEEVRKGEGHGCSKREGREENQIFVSFPRP